MLAEIFGMDGVIVLVVVAVVLFGGSQIPKLAHSLGAAQKEFKQGLKEGGSDPTPVVTVSTAPAAATAATAVDATEVTTVVVDTAV